MATIRERRDKKGVRHFHCQVRRTGFPTRTASFPNRRMAERWAATIEAQMIEGRHFRNADARRHTLADAIDRFLADYVPKLKDGSMHRNALPWWREKLGHLKLADITAPLLVEQRDLLSREPYYRSDPTAPRSELKPGQKPTPRTRKPNTVNNYLRPLSRLFTIAAKEWHWISVNPMTQVSRLDAGKGRIRYLTEDERARLLAETAKDPQLHLLVMLALATASRAGELLKLTWRDLELPEFRGVLWDTKNTEARAVWIHGETHRLLVEHRERQGDAPDPKARVFIGERGKRGRIGKRYYYRTPFAEACERAGVRDFSFHCLRHSSATYLARMGATTEQLKAIGGWKSNQVSRYVHLAPEDTRAIQERMNNKLLRGGNDEENNTK